MRNMQKSSYTWFRGVVTDINSGWGNGCERILRLEDEEGSLAEFQVTANTYFVHQVDVKVGMSVIGFYDINAPMVLSFPPRYQPIAIVQDTGRFNIKMDCFDRMLVSRDNDLALNVGPNTRVVTSNGQSFVGNPGNNLLLVFYGVSTRSIPAQTTPDEIIVFCGMDSCS